MKNALIAIAGLMLASAVAHANPCDTHRTSLNQAIVKAHEAGQNKTEAIKAKSPEVEVYSSMFRSRMIILRGAAVNAAARGCLAETDYQWIDAMLLNVGY